MVGESLYAEVVICDPNVCQVAAASEPAASVSRVSRTALPNEEGKITEEVELDGSPADDGMDSVFDDAPKEVFRFKRPVGQGCACELVERYECPVRSIHADGGELHLTFYAEELRTVREAVADLRDSCDGVHLRRLYHSGDESNSDLIYIDREMFTDRQREVLGTAHEMGYFAYPKEANAGEVADSLGIASATFTEHLSTAQAKLLDRLLNL